MTSAYLEPNVGVHKAGFRRGESEIKVEPPLLTHVSLPNQFGSPDDIGPQTMIGRAVHSQLLLEVERYRSRRPSGARSRDTNL
jgi:hypothetical protein